MYLGANVLDLVLLRVPLFAAFATGALPALYRHPLRPLQQQSWTAM